MKNSVIIRSKDFSGQDARYDFLIKNYKKGNILDIGNIGGIYGSVDNTNSSHLKFVKECIDSTVYGFDLFEPNVGKDLYKNQKYGNLEEGLPYEDETFDTVYLGELVEHLSNPGLALREINRVLKSDGVFILDTPNAYDFKKIIRYLLKREDNLGDETHIIIYTPASLKSLLEHNGFCIDTIKEKRSKILNMMPFTDGLGSHLLVVAKKP